MSFYINGALVSNPQAVSALQRVLESPDKFSLSPGRNGSQINFSLDQVLRVLNVSDPTGRSIDLNDYVASTHTCGQVPRLTQDQFVGLASEVNNRFASLLQRSGYRIDARLFYRTDRLVSMFFYEASYSPHGCPKVP